MDVPQPAGNYYDKYRTRNPIARAMMAGFLQSFDELAAQIPPSDALEIGCGEGELSMRLARDGWRVKGCDIAPEAIDEARIRAQAAGLAVEYEVASIDAVPARYAATPLVVCCEVMEHLIDPGAALEILSGISTGYLLVSVPREPLWRVLNMARGRYWRDLGNTPGHIQHWSKRRFLTLLSTRLEVISVRSPLPWTMALCRIRGR